jgi:putative peptidoglycan lipid II flippase
MTPDEPDGRTEPVAPPSEGDAPEATQPVLGTAEPAEETPQSFVRSSAVMSVGTGLSRLTGFLRVAAMAYALGVTESRLADSFNVANTTPNIIYELALGGILSSVFIPVFVERLENGGQDQAWHTARTLLTFAGLFLTAVMVVGILGSGLIIRLYTSQAHGPEVEAERALASFFLKWFMPQIVFYGLGAGVATGLLNAHRKFAMPMFAPILNNLISTATFLVFAVMAHHRSVTPGTITQPERYVLAIGTTLGIVGMTAVLWPSLRRVGFRWRWTLDFADAGFRRIGRLAGWAFVYVIVNQIGYTVVIVLASRVRGGYTAYTSAFLFFQLPYAIFAVSIMTALLPSLSSHWSEGERSEFGTLLSQGIRGTAFIVVPAAFGYLALATPVVRLLLQHGVMQAQSTALLARVLIFFSFGLFSFSAFQLLLRAFYAMQDTRTPALINVAAVGINIAADIVLFRYLKVEGLALGHATAYTFASIAALVMLRRRLGSLEGRRIGAALAKIGAGGLAAGAASYVASTWVGDVLGTTGLGPQLLQVSGGVVAGLGAFIAMAVAFRLQELALLKRMVMVRLGRS